MTTIAAIQGENWAAIGYDSRLTEDNSKIYTLPKDNGKVNRNGPYLIGAAGDMRAINILTHVFKPPAVSPNLYGAKLDKFISSRVKGILSIFFSFLQTISPFLILVMVCLGKLSRF